MVSAIKKNINRAQTLWYNCNHSSLSFCCCCLEVKFMCIVLVWFGERNTDQALLIFLSVFYITINRFIRGCTCWLQALRLFPRVEEECLERCWYKRQNPYQCKLRRKTKSVPSRDVGPAAISSSVPLCSYRRNDIPFGGTLQQRPLSCTALCWHTARLQSYHGRQRSWKPSEVSVPRHSQRQGLWQTLQLSAEWRLGSFSVLNPSGKQLQGQEATQGIWGEEEGNRSRCLL